MSAGPKFPEIRAQTRRDFYSLWDGWRLKEKRKPSEWATQERRIAAGQSPLGDGEDIAYDHVVMPHCVEPMDDADNPEVNMIVLWMARRMGKTEGICGNVVGRTVTDDPGNIYSMWPVEDSADRFSRDVIEPMIEATPALNRVFVERKSRDSGRTIDYKRFHGGSLYLVNAGSKSKSRGMAAKVVLLHEPDAYPVSSQGEGDPISKALGRADGFGEAIKFIEGTGTYTAETDDNGKKVYRSNIELWFDRGDQRKWFCPCRKCGREQVIMWEHFQLRRGNVYVVCEHCDAEHNEAQWRRMVLAARWKPTAPFINGVRSYWINQFCCLLPRGKGFKSKLHQFYIEGLRALAGKPEEKQVWVCEVKAELWSPEGEAQPAPPYQPILDGRESYATDDKVIVPAQAMLVTSFTDVQENRLEVEWRAWDRTEQNWGLGHFVIEGRYNDRETWGAWIKHLQKKWRHESGAMLGLTFGMIDGGKWGDVVADAVRRINREVTPGVAGRIRVSKGVGEANAVVFRKGGQITPGWKGVHIGTWLAKEILYERFRWHGAEGKPQEGFVHFGQCYSEEFIRQLVSEKPERVRNKFGAEILKFKNPDHVRNEAIDLLVGNLACYRYRNRWDWETIERTIKDDAERAKSNDKAAPKLKPVKRFQGKGWSL